MFTQHRGEYKYNKKTLNIHPGLLDRNEQKLTSQIYNSFNKKIFFHINFFDIEK
jgi:hypothetical protein